MFNSADYWSVLNLGTLSLKHIHNLLPVNASQTVKCKIYENSKSKLRNIYLSIQELKNCFHTGSYKIYNLYHSLQNVSCLFGK